jgi:nicotinamidase-related amidase
MYAFVVIDMQVGMLDGTPKHDLQAVVGRVNAVAAMAVIEHHNWVWSGLLTRRSIRVAATRDLLAEAGPEWRP